MTEPDLEPLRFPLGRFELHVPRPEEVPGGIECIARLPAELRAAVSGLDDEQLDTPYRPGGWSPRQVVAHVADSHMNSVSRFKLALTEDVPTIRPYFEDRWAELADYREPVEVGLSLLDALHARWVTLLRSLGPAELSRSFLHPEHGEVIRLDTNVMLYAWHGEHHTRHVTALRERNGW